MEKTRLAMTTIINGGVSVNLWLVFQITFGHVGYGFEKPATFRHKRMQSL